MYVPPASSFSNSVGVVQQKIPPNKFHHHFTTFIKSSSMMYDFTGFTLDLSSFHLFPSNPKPSRPPKLPVVGATTCRRGLLWLREPLAIGDGTATSGSPGSQKCGENDGQKWIRKTSDTVIWGLFGDDFGIIWR